MSVGDDGQPPFAAVIVIHDSERFLPGLLASLKRHVTPAPEIVVVDTGSVDDGAAVARAHGATVIDRPDNPGFGAANNLAVARIRSEVCALLNPDIELLDDGIQRLVALAKRRSALLVPRLLNPDGTTQRSAHPKPGGVHALLPALIHPSLLPRAVRLRADPWRAEQPRTVGWALAACLVARTELLRSLGPFDERIFLFYEDLDLALRAAQRSIPIELHPQVFVRHFGSHSTLPAYGEEPIELHARLRRQVVEANLGRQALALDDIAQSVAFTTRAAARLVLGRDASRELTQLRAVRTARSAGFTALSHLR